MTTGCFSTFGPYFINEKPKTPLQSTSINCEIKFECDGKMYTEKGIISEKRRKGNGCDYEYKCAGSSAWIDVKDSGSAWEIFQDNTGIYDCNKIGSQQCIAVKKCKETIGGTSSIFDFGQIQTSNNTDDCSNGTYCLFLNAKELNYKYPCAGSTKTYTGDGECCIFQYEKLNGGICNENNATIENFNTIGLDKSLTGYATYSTCKDNIIADLKPFLNQTKCPEGIKACTVSNCILEFCTVRITKNGKEYDMWLIRSRCDNIPTLNPIDINGDGKFGLCDAFKLTTVDSDPTSVTVPAWPNCYKPTSILPKIQATNTSSALNSFSILKSYIFPNPFEDVLNIVVQSECDYQSKIVVRDLSGRTIHEENVILQKGGNQIALQSANIFQNTGVYIIEVLYDNGEKALHKSIHIK